MSKIIAQAMVWNAAQFVAAPILAVHKYVDEIQVFDGAYQFMQDAGYAKVPWSTDGTAQIVWSLRVDCPLKWIPCTDFYENEVAKKSFMQQEQYWKPDTWRYLLADDEIPVGDLAIEFGRVRSAKDELCAYLRFYEPFFDKRMECHIKYLGWKPRFHMWQLGLHYRGRHDLFHNVQGRKVSEWRPRLVLEDISMLHYKHIRPKERLIPQLRYEALQL